MKRSKLNRQNMFFVWSAILAVGSGLAVLKDFNPEWKTYQKRFMKLTLERAEKEIATENAKVEVKYKARLDDLDHRIRGAKDQTQSVNHQQVVEAKQAEIAELTLAEARVSQKLSFGKSQLGAVRSKYEFQKNDHYADPADVKKNKAEYERLFQLVQDLTPKADEAYAKLGHAKDELKEINKGASALELERGEIVAQMDQWKKDIEKIQPSNIANYTANIVRDLPLLDFVDPKFKLQQVVLNDLPDITKSAKVDRCVTCHVGIADERYAGEGVGNPYRAHPKMDLFVGLNSPHPLAKFGCTTCHLGRGYGTTFALAAHSPNNEEQAKEWKSKYGWDEMHYWDYPMLPKKNIEAMCVSCHPSTQEIRMAKNVFEGRQIYERRGCHGCHKIEGVSDVNGARDMPKVGPTLKKLAAKLDPEWTARWIAGPRAFYKDARMPHIFGHQIPSEETFPEYMRHMEETNPGALKDLKRDYENMKADDAVMIESVTAWLYSKSDPEFIAKLAEPPAEAGDAEAGKELFKVVNCLGCHSQSAIEAKGQGYAPDLSKIGSKTNRKWLFNWLKDPKLYWPESRMPNPRLTDKEANDISAYLLTLKDDAFMAAPKAVGESNRLEDLAVRYLRAKMPEDKAIAKVAGLDENARKLYVGEETLYRRGCFGCHDIGGFEERPRIGAELTAEGYKEIELFDFGQHKYVHLPHNRHSWIDNKVKMPYSYFLGAVTNPYEQNFYMPWFGFTEEEAAKVTTFILGQTGKAPPEKYRYDLVGDVKRKQIMREGRKAIERKNCTGCHPVGLQWTYMDTPHLPESLEKVPMWTSDPIVAKYDANLAEGKFAKLDQVKTKDLNPKDKLIIPETGFIQRETVLGGDYYGMNDLFGKDPIQVNIGGKDEIRIPMERPAQVRVYGDNEAHIYQYYSERPKAPPVLRKEGAKVNPEWFFNFLKNVQTIRTNIDVRMPQWHWTDEDATAIVTYFAAAANEPFPFQSVEISEFGDAHRTTARDLFGIPGAANYSSTLQCMSCHPSGGLTPSSPKDNWGPDLNQSQARLKVPFLKAWITDPEAWAGHGTKMPTVFYEADGDQFKKVRPDAESEISRLAEMIHYLPQIEDLKLAAAMASEFSKSGSEGAAAPPAEGSAPASAPETPAATPQPPAAAAPAPASVVPAPAPAPAPAAPAAPAASGGDGFDN